MKMGLYQSQVGSRRNRGTGGSDAKLQNRNRNRTDQFNLPQNRKEPKSILRTAGNRNGRFWQVLTQIDEKNNEISSKNARFLSNFTKLRVYGEFQLDFKQLDNCQTFFIRLYYHKAILMGLLCQISKTVRTEEPNTIKPEPNAIQLLEPESEPVNSGTDRALIKRYI